MLAPDPQVSFKQGQAEVYTALAVDALLQLCTLAAPSTVLRILNERIRIASAGRCPLRLEETIIVSDTLKEALNQTTST